MKVSIRVSKTNFLKEFLIERLEKYLANVYYGQCHTSDYPRLELSLRQLSADEDYFYKYILTLNLYDKFTSSAIDNIIDEINDDIGLAEFYADKFFVKIIRQNDRQHIAETDKQLQHIMTSYEVRLYPRRDYL